MVENWPRTQAFSTHSDQREKRGGKPGEFTHMNDIRVDRRYTPFNWLWASETTAAGAHSLSGAQH